MSIVGYQKIKLPELESVRRLREGGPGSGRKKGGAPNEHSVVSAHLDRVKRIHGNYDGPSKGVVNEDKAADHDDMYMNHRDASYGPSHMVGGPYLRRLHNDAARAHASARNAYQSGTPGGKEKSVAAWAASKAASKYEDKHFQKESFREGGPGSGRHSSNSGSPNFQGRLPSRYHFNTMSDHKDKASELKKSGRADAANLHSDAAAAHKDAMNAHIRQEFSWSLKKPLRSEETPQRANKKSFAAIAASHKANRAAKISKAEESFREGGPGSGRHAGGGKDYQPGQANDAESHHAAAAFHLSKISADHNPDEAIAHLKAFSAHKEAEIAHNFNGTGGGALYGPDDAHRLSRKARNASKSFEDPDQPHYTPGLFLK